uniref:Uncharacterized protein n=1 Tax=Romanomermis culicivorax TaxID=13658 RepID=A0A915JIJ7_ROMCU
MVEDSIIFRHPVVKQEKISASKKSWSNHKCETVIRFWVKVPVLSEQMVLVDPKVSTASKCFTKQFFLAIRFAVKK